MQEAIYARIQEIAREKDLITYSKLNKELKLGLDFNFDKDRKQIGEWLGEISQHEVQLGHPMLSAVVVQQESDGSFGHPGEGFYNIAKDLNVFRGNNKFIFWVSELNAVHNYWSSH